MNICLFASDLHGDRERYNKLLRIISKEEPQAVFIGGDLLPSALKALSSDEAAIGDFIRDYLLAEMISLKRQMKEAYPRVFIIMGNDDGRLVESALVEAETLGLWEYVHMRRVLFGAYPVYGYSYVPPTPFLFKDWERYDVSRFVDPGCISPEEGMRSIEVDVTQERHATIQGDLDRLAVDDGLENAIFLFHAPPYKTKLDRAALDGKTVDQIPLDLHIGSIAIRRFIEVRQPLLTLHGHVHESAHLTGSWRDLVGRTVTFSAAHDGPELALVRFNLEDLHTATRELL
jgi:Icc-related predicted phosphoesterase